MKKLKEELTKAGIAYVSECLGGNIEGIRIEHNLYIVEHGSGTGYYVGNLDDESDTCYALEDVLELVRRLQHEHDHD